MNIPLSHNPDSLNAVIKICSIVVLVTSIIAAGASVFLFYWGNQKDTLNKFASDPRTLNSTFVNQKALINELKKYSGTEIQILSVAGDLESEEFGNQFFKLLEDAGWKPKRARSMIGGVSPRDITIFKSNRVLIKEELALKTILKYLNYNFKIIDENNNPFNQKIDPNLIVLDIGLKY
ncbi:hypothetical protein [Mucilaginibacter celer]|uniref:Uncharacterized protein n=1 Tax=Mucilaginibacter celer TaxID=2305508 RepID=A0A494VUV9_9SPHI|nr:hypothetical protein [Mucilaginibacter celer]AYL97841.1 hypothetical protein HYN43_022210 [Mucilaginibacter celer]